MKFLVVPHSALVYEGRWGKCGWELNVGRLCDKMSWVSRYQAIIITILTDSSLTVLTSHHVVWWNIRLTRKVMIYWVWHELLILILIKHPDNFCCWLLQAVWKSFVKGNLWIWCQMIFCFIYCGCLPEASFTCNGASSIKPLHSVPHLPSPTLLTLLSPTLTR